MVVEFNLELKLFFHNACFVDGNTWQIMQGYIIYSSEVCKVKFISVTCGSQGD